MTPEEHYKEAELLIEQVNKRRKYLSASGAAEMIAVAQVHATLANAPAEQVDVRLV